MASIEAKSPVPESTFSIITVNFEKLISLTTPKNTSTLWPTKTETEFAPSTNGSTPEILNPTPSVKNVVMFASSIRIEVE